MTEAKVHPVARLPEEWQQAMAARGQRAFHAKQIFRWIHQRSVMDPHAMTDLSKAMRTTLSEEGLAAPLTVERVHRAQDDTRKLLVRMEDGSAVETVLLPVGKPGVEPDADAAAAEDEEEAPSDEMDPARMADGAIRKTKQIRVTQCISTQVGCAIGCVFCASGLAGLKRHMTAAEIVSQVLLGNTLLDKDEAIRNVVFMGMGEPLHNYDETARAIRLMTHPDGLALAARRITVSTSGLIPEIDRLGSDFEGQVGLAISVHNADDARRSKLMPINDRYPLGPLMEALRRYPLPGGRRITVEYTLVRGQNDALDDARKLAKRLRGLRVKINVIPMNPIEHSKLGPPAMDRVHAFQELLSDEGYLCFVRRRRGDDVSAACGQLALGGAAPIRSFLKRQPAEPDSD